MRLATSVIDPSIANTVAKTVPKPTLKPPERFESISFQFIRCINWVNNIVLLDSQNNRTYVPAHRSTYGPKQYSFASHYDHTGLTLTEKTRDLREFLSGRGEMSKFPDLMTRMKELHNPALEGRSWTTKF